MQNVYQTFNDILVNEFNLDPLSSESLRQLYFEGDETREELYMIAEGYTNQYFYFIGY